MTSPIPTHNSLPMRHGCFPTLPEALDYAARGRTGCTFFDGRGRVSSALTYAQLREEAIEIARRLTGLGVPGETVVGLVADTHPDFLRGFFACQYAGFVPVPLPANVPMGRTEAYVEHLKRLLSASGAKVLLTPPTFSQVVSQASQRREMAFAGDLQTLCTSVHPKGSLPRVCPESIAYI